MAPHEREARGPALKSVGIGPGLFGVGSGWPMGWGGSGSTLTVLVALGANAEARLHLAGITAVTQQARNFVTQHEDLDVFRCIGAGEQRQPAQHASEHQVDESEGHSG